MDLQTALLSIVMFIICVTLHEFAHAWVAFKCGDDTAKKEGRISFNPLAHVDPIGTVILPLVLMMTNATFIIGWAKPVPVNLSRLRDRREDEYWISLAGPLANFIQAVAGAVILGLLVRIGIVNSNGLIFSIGIFFIRTNIGLGIFNLLPIPPLDGFSVLKNVLPQKFEASMESFEPMGMFIMLILLSSGALGNVIFPIFSKALGLVLRLMQIVAIG